ncbi:kinesin-like protein KIF14 [Watersipora subatra]|uniref:kinesin-like protein KIF14 n=1 Tax=Watersipora subatra TaxID=2589382 RepID=UPI00355C2E45
MSGRISDILSGGRSSSAETKRSRFSANELGNISDDSSNGLDSCAVTVAVRVRPFAPREERASGNRRVVSMQGCETLVQANESSPVHTFQYDYSFDSFDETRPGFSSQAKVYECLARPLLTRAFQGYNTCLFAYGQTGSGKSYSIMGHGDEDGIIPRFSEELFDQMKSRTIDSGDVTAITVETSFFEIYNEKIHDLLAVSKGNQQTDKASMRVREHPEQGPYVEGLSTFPVASFHDIVKLLTLGNQQRATASTGMNDKSSRSHSVFTLHLTQHKRVEVEENLHEHSVVSKISLVDLAGSERQSSANTSGARLKEGASINKSLLTLGKVISVLAEQNVQAKKRKLFVPYRDSVLTWLLRESLGGNARTAMLATVSPSLLNIEETLSTLRYAQQARSIINMAKVNEDPKARLIRELRLEIERLRAQQQGQGGEDLGAMQEILSLRKALQEKELDMQIKLRDWQTKLASAEEKMRLESSALEHTGIAATSINNKLPNLVNLNEDPQLSEILLYVLKQGRTKVGRQGALNQDCDIQLSGALVSDYHCELFNEKEGISIAPFDKDAPTFVNGQQITRTVRLQHVSILDPSGAVSQGHACPACLAQHLDCRALLLR